MTLEQVTRQMVKDSRTWILPHLCMKQPNNKPDGVFPRCGIITREDRYTIRNHPDKLSGEFAERFDGVEAMLAAGWVVD